MVAIECRDPLRHHLVGGRPLTQAPRISAAEREEFPVCRDQGRVFETTRQLHAARDIRTVSKENLFMNKRCSIFMEHKVLSYFCERKKLFKNVKKFSRMNVLHGTLTHVQGRGCVCACSPVPPPPPAEPRSVWVVSDARCCRDPVSRSPHRPS